MNVFFPAELLLELSDAVICQTVAFFRRRGAPRLPERYARAHIFNLVFHHSPSNLD